MCFNKLRKYLINMLFRKHHKLRPKISLLIPFSSNDPYRRKSFKWLLQYWKYELPEAEIIIGKSNSKIFCKGEALNNAAKKAKGEILVILDADAYINGGVINKCADRIIEELEYENHLWYVPYRNLYRLNKHATSHVLDSDPKYPYRFTVPPPNCDIENKGHSNKYGHRYGAMIMMFPREALNILGCFDERFKGWGGEDVALLRALDTLYGKHRTTNNDILHLWHPFYGENYKTRIWKGQQSANPNSELANKYNHATRHPSRMRQLVDEGCKYKNRK